MGHVPHLSHRFSFEQSGKVRSIDDLLESGINTTFGCQDKLVLHDVDFVAAVNKTIERALSGTSSLVSVDGQ